MQIEPMLGNEGETEKLESQSASLLSQLHWPHGPFAFLRAIIVRRRTSFICPWLPNVQLSFYELNSFWLTVFSLCSIA